MNTRWKQGILALPSIGVSILPKLAMLFRAKARRGYGPFLLGVLAGIGVLVGKFVWESSPAMYGAVGLLVIASLWNTWPRREKPDEPRARSHCNTEKIERSI